MSQSRLNHTWIFLYLSYIWNNIFDILSQYMSQVITLSFYMRELYLSEIL